jgi:hypothetical protein
MHADGGSPHGPPYPHLDRRATAGITSVARPRLSSLCPRAGRLASEDRERPNSPSGRHARTLEATRSRYRVCMARPVSSLGDGRADRSPPGRLPSEVSLSTPNRSENDSTRVPVSQPARRSPSPTPAPHRAVGRCGPSGAPSNRSEALPSGASGVPCDDAGSGFARGWFSNTALIPTTLLSAIICSNA